MNGTNVFFESSKVLLIYQIGVFFSRTLFVTSLKIILKKIEFVLLAIFSL